jgi:hypothetical protein
VKRFAAINPEKAHSDVQSVRLRSEGCRLAALSSGSSILFSKFISGFNSIATMRCDASYELCLLPFCESLMHASHLRRGFDSGECLGRINNKHKILACNEINGEFTALHDKWKTRGEWKDLRACATRDYLNVGEFVSVLESTQTHNRRWTER